jgi:sec-independent protein translocase protein TatC
MENIKPLNSSGLESFIKRFSPFIAEIKRKLLFIISVFIIGTIGGFVFNDQIIRFLVDILSLKGVNIVFTSPFQFINLAIATGVATGITLAFPVIIIQLISFLKPALKPQEYKMVVGFLPFSIFLFLVGFISGILMMQWQVQIFLSRSITLGIGNLLDVSHLLSIVIITSVLMGVAFQIPIILLILMRIGILKHDQVTRKRPWVYLGSFIFAVLLPPDSVIFDILATLPLIILFEFTLLLNRILGKSKRGKAILEET